MKDYLCIFTIINKNIIHSKYFADRVSDWLQPPANSSYINQLALTIERCK